MTFAIPGLILAVLGCTLMLVAALWDMTGVLRDILSEIRKGQASDHTET